MKKLLFAIALALLFSNTAFAQRIYDDSGRQIGRVDGERYSVGPDIEEPQIPHLG
jgi:hypothetical protein